MMDITTSVVVADALCVSGVQLSADKKIFVQLHHLRELGSGLCHRMTPEKQTLTRVLRFFVFFNLLLLVVAFMVALTYNVSCVSVFFVSVI